MARYLCHTNKQSLWESINSSCLRHSVCLTDIDGDKKSLRHKSWDDICTIDLELHETSDGHSTIMTIGGKLGSKHILAKRILLVIIIAIFYVSVYHLFIPDLISRARIVSFIFAVFAIITTWYCIMPNRITKNILAKVIDGVDCNLIQIEAYSLNIRDGFVVFSLVLLILPQVILAPFIFNFSLTFLFTIPILSAFVFFNSDKKASCGWRRYCNYIYGAWHFPCLIPIAIIILMSTEAFLLYGKIAESRVDSIFSIGSVISQAIKFPVIEVLSSAEYASYLFGNSNVSPAAARSCVISGVMYLLIYICLLGFLSVMFLREKATLKLSCKLENFIAMSIPILPYSRSRFSAILKALLSSATTWLYVWLSIEIACYLLLRDNLLLNWVGLTIEVHIRMAILSGLSDGLAHTLVVFLCLVLIIPAVATIAINGWRLLILFAFHLKFIFKRSDQIPEQNQQWIESLCDKSNLPVPKIQLLDSGDINILTEGTLFKGYGIIKIDKACFKCLQPESIDALLAHEIAHLQNDTHIAARLKVLSSLMLCPFYYLMIFYDFPGNEFKADTFSKDSVGHAKPLIDALVYQDFYRCMKDKQELPEKHSPPQIIKYLSYLTALSRMFFDNSLYSTAYPHIKIRLNRLSNYI